MKTFRSQFILCIIGAGLLTLSFPKADQGWLAWFALVPLLLAVRQASHKNAFVLGFSFGMVHYLGLVYWTVHTMHRYGNLPVYQAVTLLILLAGYLSLFPGLFAALLAWLRPKPLSLPFIAPAAWCALEILRTHIFTGFPWALLGYSQYDHLWLIQFADLFGVYGVSFFIILVNAVLTLAVLGWLEVPWQDQIPTGRSITYWGALVTVLAAGVNGYGIWRIKVMEELAKGFETAKVAVIQGNIDQAQKWDPSFQVLTTVKYRNLSLQPKVRGADLVIWPETAAPFYFTDDEILSKMVIEGIKTAGAFFIIGSPSYAADKAAMIYHNSAYIVSPDGKIQGQYDKVHLVPFGEYVPLKAWLPFIDKLVAQVGDFKPGRSGNTLRWENHQVGMLICYEVIFPDLARAMVNNGAHLLVNITNDAWFGRTSAAYQHFSMAVFRAVENRRTLARAANTGISGFIDPCGRIISPTGLFQEAAVMAPVTLMKTTSNYTRWGEWPLGLLVFGSILFFTARQLRLKNRTVG
ncbi:MAG: apolipoprotein N-acyltransferase [Desulfobacteraceae bacterium]